jgi:hypothetical protein
VKIFYFADKRRFLSKSREREDFSDFLGLWASKYYKGNLPMKLIISLQQIIALHLGIKSRFGSASHNFVCTHMRIAALGTQVAWRYKSAF